MRIHRFALIALTAIGLSISLSQGASAQTNIYNWTGFYVGGNAGFGWADASATYNGVISVTGTETLGGIVGGGQLGFNYQDGYTVYGIELDGQASSQRINSNFAGLVTLTDKVPWFATLRGRVGIGVEKYFVYVTGGAAYVGWHSDITVAGFGSATWSISRPAYTIGTGLETGVTRNLSVKVEYLFIDTGSFSTTYFGVIPITARLQDNIVRFGINYRL
jgi:outer membrane immunogenic protein